MFQLLYLSILPLCVHFIKNINITFIDFLGGYKLGLKTRPWFYIWLLFYHGIVHMPWFLSLMLMEYGKARFKA